MREVGAISLYIRLMCDVQYVPDAESQWISENRPKMSKSLTGDHRRMGVWAEWRAIGRNRMHGTLTGFACNSLTVNGPAGFDGLAGENWGKGSLAPRVTADSLLNRVPVA